MASTTTTTNPATPAPQFPVNSGASTPGHFAGNASTPQFMSEIEKEKMQLKKRKIDVVYGFWLCFVDRISQFYFS